MLENWQIRGLVQDPEGAREWALYLANGRPAIADLETRRVVSAFEAPTVCRFSTISHMVGQAVEQRHRHLGVAEHAGPFADNTLPGRFCAHAEQPPGELCARVTMR
jgi:hypothetical protein